MIGRALGALLKGVLAILALGIGTSIVCWVLYNELVDRLPQYQRPPLAGVFGIAPIMILVGVRWGREALKCLRPTRVGAATSSLSPASSELNRWRT